MTMAPEANFWFCKWNMAKMWHSQGWRINEWAKPVFKKFSLKSLLAESVCFCPSTPICCVQWLLMQEPGCHFSIALYEHIFLSRSFLSINRHVLYVVETSPHSLTGKNVVTSIKKNLNLYLDQKENSKPVNWKLNSILNYEKGDTQKE